MTYFLESGIVISETRKTNNIKMEDKKMRKINEVGEGLLLVLSSYMKVNLMAKVASELSPCSSAEFIKRYCELDTSFEDVLKEFGIDL